MITQGTALHTKHRTVPDGGKLSDCQRLHLEGKVINLRLFNSGQPP